MCILRSQLTLGISPAGGCSLLCQWFKINNLQHCPVSAPVFKGDIVKCDIILLTNDSILISLWRRVGRVMW